jgi:predicted metalloendopeptidase
MKRSFLRTTLSAAALVGLVGCPGGKDKTPPVKEPGKTGTKEPAKNPSKEPTPDAAPAAIYDPYPLSKDAEVVKVSLAEIGLDPEALDRTMDPCQDFFQFACGNWVAKTEIPADKPLWMRSFLAIEDTNQAYLKTALEKSITQKGSKDPVEKKIGAFYGACMDEKAVDAAGTKALKPLLGAINKVKDQKSLVAAVTELHKHQLWVLFDLSSLQDSKDATQVIAGMDQNGLGLPDRDYYFIDEKKSPEEQEKAKKLQESYKAYMTKVLTLGGMKQAEAETATADIFALETEIAKISMTRVQRRDPNATYNRIEREGLKKATPSFPWDDYFKNLGSPSLTTITVSSVKYFEGLEALFAATDAKVWREYLTFHLLAQTSGALSKPFVDAGFEFAKSLTGQSELPPRWKRCVESTDGALGELIGQSFVKDKFAGDSKTAAEEMVKTISSAFGENLSTLDWMDETTKIKAREKLTKMAYLIGYPSKWKNYDFKIDAKNYAANVLASQAFELKRNLAKVGKPVDREEWYMTPPTVNAYYDPQVNQMVFPAGILQPPFYSVSYTIPVNLGAIGMVVGHELTHGFDDQGAQFDADGNLKDWWSGPVKEKFQAKTKCVVDQYAQYETVPGVKLNGELTQGENIADIGGLKMAFRAYRMMRQGARKVQEADGFSEDQQFFLSFAQGWCAKSREEFARLTATVDPHSPARWRVNGPISDTPEFARAFSCKAGTPMAPKKSCTVW